MQCRNVLESTRTQCLRSHGLWRVGHVEGQSVALVGIVGVFGSELERGVVVATNTYILIGHKLRIDIDRKTSDAVLRVVTLVLEHGFVDASLAHIGNYAIGVGNEVIVLIATLRNLS